MATKQFNRTVEAINVLLDKLDGLPVTPMAKKGTILNPSYLPEDATEGDVYLVLYSDSGNAQTANSLYYKTASNWEIIATKGYTPYEIDDMVDGLTDRIAINENNILSLYKSGSANILKNTAQTQTVGGVTFTMNADGSITANGTKTDNEWLYLSTGNSLKAGTYVLSSGGIIGDDKLVIVTTSDSLGSAIMLTNTATGVYERELTQDYSGLYFAIRIASGTVCDNLLFKPMLCEKSVYETINGEYQPYAPSNRELFNMIMAL